MPDATLTRAAWTLDMLLAVPRCEELGQSSSSSLKNPKQVWLIGDAQVTTGTLAAEGPGNERTGDFYLPYREVVLAACQDS